MPNVAADLVASLRPAACPSAELIAGGGNYVRRDGRWLYAAAEQPVPGAADVTLAQRYAALPRERRDGQEYVFVDRVWLDDPVARPELAWCAPFVVETLSPPGPSFGTTHASAVAVPSAELAARGAVVVGLTAPELDPADLLTASAIAQLLGVTRSTVNAYHSRGQMPAPVVTLNQRLPLWARPIIHQWIAAHTRRHRHRRP